MGTVRHRYDMTEAMAKERRVVQLRLAGVPWEAIAEQVGYASKGAAYNAWMRANERVLKPPAEALRNEATERAETLLSAQWANAMRGDTRAAEVCRRLLDQIARLNGLYAPVKVQQEVTVHEGSDIDRRVQELAELLAKNDPQDAPAP